jgi:hypothetical protein
MTVAEPTAGINGEDQDEKTGDGKTLHGGY